MDRKLVARASPAGRALASLSAAAPGILVALLPKCPVCLAAYLMLLTGLTADRLPLEHVWGFTLGALGVSLALVLWRAWTSRRPAAFAVALAGAAVAVGGRCLGAPTIVILLGAAAMAAGATWASVRGKGAPALGRRSETCCFG